MVVEIPTSVVTSILSENHDSWQNPNLYNILTQVEMRIYAYGSNSYVDLKSHAFTDFNIVNDRDSMIERVGSPFDIQNSSLNLENVVMTFMREALHLKKFPEIQRDLATATLWSWNASSLPQRHYFVIMKRPSIEFEEIQVERNNYKKAFVVVDDITFNFITCDSVTVDSSRLSYAANIIFFYSPFEVWIWVTTLGLLISIPTILWIVAYKAEVSASRYLHRNKFKSFVFNLHLSVANLLENGKSLHLQQFLNEMPPLFGSVAYSLLSSWLIYLFFNNNLYKGVLTSSEIVLNPITTKWNRIVDLVDFQFVTPTIAERWRYLDVPTRTIQRTQFGNSLALTIKQLKQAGLLHTFNFPYLLTLFGYITNNDDMGHRGWSVQNKSAFYDFVKNCN